MNYELFHHKDKLVDQHTVTKKIFLVDMKRENQPFFSELTEKWLQKYYHQHKKIAIILNKKWLSSGHGCQKCGHIPHCHQCDIPIAYHKIDQSKRWKVWTFSEIVWLCQICKTQYEPEKTCSQCWSPNIKEYGLGIQKVGEILQQQHNMKSLIVDTQSANSPKKVERLYAHVHEHGWPYPVIIGTSLLTIPLAWYQFDLIIFLNADIGLHIPDFTAQERTFLQLYETFIKHTTQQFIVQTLNPDNETIRDACRLNFPWFYEREWLFRKEHDYPPYAELCVLHYKNEIEDKLYNKIHAIYQELLFLQKKYQMDDIAIYTTPPLIYKMFGKYRYQIILKGKNLRQFTDIIFSKLNLTKRWFKVDRNAHSIV